MYLIFFLFLQKLTRSESKAMYRLSPQGHQDRDLVGFRGVSVELGNISRRREKVISAGDMSTAWGRIPLCTTPLSPKMQQYETTGELIDLLPLLKLPKGNMNKNVLFLF